MTHVVIADDHPLCRKATELAVRQVVPDAEVSEVDNLGDALDKVTTADLVVLDLIMPENWGLAGLLAIRALSEVPPILIQTGHDDRELSQLVRSAGANGFVPKRANFDELKMAIETVLAGDSWFRGTHSPKSSEKGSLADRIASLTPAERRVLAGMADGSLNKQIAYRLDLSEITVKQHVKSILRKMNAINRTQAALMIQLHDGDEAIREAVRHRLS